MKPIILLVAICVHVFCEETTTEHLTTAQSKARAADDGRKEETIERPVQYQPTSRQQPMPRSGQQSSSPRQQRPPFVPEEQDYQQPHIHRPYSFNYISEAEDGMSSHQQASDQNGKVVGSYMISLADGRKRIVDYIADENGFRANVRSNEPGTSFDESPADAFFHSSGFEDFNSNQLGPGTRSGIQQDQIRPYQPETFPRRDRQPSRGSRRDDNRSNTNQDSPISDFQTQPRGVTPASRRLDYPTGARQRPSPSVYDRNQPRNTGQAAPPTQYGTSIPSVESNQTDSEPGLVRPNDFRSYIRGRPSFDTPDLPSVPEDNRAANLGSRRYGAQDLPEPNSEQYSYFRQGQRFGERANVPTNPQDDIPSPYADPNAPVERPDGRQYQSRRRQAGVSARSDIPRTVNPSSYDASSPAQLDRMPSYGGSRLPGSSRTMDSPVAYGSPDQSLDDQVGRQPQNPFDNSNQRSQPARPRFDQDPRVYNAPQPSLVDNYAPNERPDNDQSRGPASSNQPSLTSYYYRGTSSRDSPNLRSPANPNYPRSAVPQSDNSNDEERRSSDEGNVPTKVAPDSDVDKGQETSNGVDSSSPDTVRSTEVQPADRSSFSRRNGNAQVAPGSNAFEQPLYYGPGIQPADDGPHYHRAMPYYYYHSGPDYFFHRN